MKFAILITGHPAEGKSHDSALAFCRSVIASGHDIYRLFFFSRGVLGAQRAHNNTLEACDQATQAWSAFLVEHPVDATVCIGSVKKYHDLHDMLASGFEIAGLGQYVDMNVQADRIIHFG